MEDELITLRGNRELWLKFTYAIKRRRKKVWDILKPLIKKYVKEKE